MAISIEKLLTLSQFQTGLQASKNYTDGKVTELNTAIGKKANQSALDETNSKVGNLETQMETAQQDIADNETAINNEVTRAKAAEQANATGVTEAKSAASNADAKAVKAQEEVDALELEVAGVKGSVATNTGDISTLKQKVQTLEASGYDDTEVRGLISANGEKIFANEEAIADNAEAIEVLNGTGDGSVKKTVDDAINKFATDVTDNGTVDKFKELVDWVAEHGSEAGEMAEGIQTNANDIDALETGKADKATTLAGYGIADAYTTAQADAKTKELIASEVVINVATDEEVTGVCNTVFSTTAA